MSGKRQEQEMQFSDGFVNDVAKLYEMAGHGEDFLKVHLPIRPGKELVVDLSFTTKDV